MRRCVLAALFLLTDCHLLLDLHGSRPAEAGADRPALVDRKTDPDRPRDLPLALADLPSSPDQARPDQSKPDQSKPDQSKPDQRLDQNKPDQSKPTDLSPPPACVGTAHVAMIYAANMVVCVDNNNAAGNCTPSSPCFTQCSAFTLCAPPWSLCTASQFLARGGKGTAALSTRLSWLASCIRNGGGVSAPSNDTCTPNCTSASGVGEIASWSCSGALPDPPRDDLYLGLASDTLCARAGVNAPSASGFWLPHLIGEELPGAVCCQ